jgi:hypothetical protein
LREIEGEAPLAVGIRSSKPHRFIGSAMASSPGYTWLFGFDASTGQPLILENS